MEKTEFAKQMGENICRYREKCCMTQAELAEKIGVGTAFLSRVERGEKSMRLYTLCKLAEVLEVSCDALLCPSDASAKIDSIIKLLEGRSDAYLEGVEDMIRTCNRHFAEEQKQAEEP